MKENSSLSNQLFIFFGVLLLLMGIFGGLKTLYNLVAYDKYPLDNAIPSNVLLTTWSGGGTYFQSELDCKQQSQLPYYGPSGELRSPSEEEKMNQKLIEDSCLERLAKQRENTKVSDISQTAFLLLLGGGMLWARKKV